MKKVEYKFVRESEKHNYDENPEQYFKLFIEPSSKTKNKWWKSLDSFYGFVGTHLDIIKQTAQKLKRGSDTTQIPKTAKFCPAINSILDNGLKIKFPTDVYITIDSNGVWTWQIPPVSTFCDPTGFNIVGHSDDQWKPRENAIYEDHLNIKFSLPVAIKSDVPFVYLEPQYEKIKHPFKVMNGVVTNPYTNYSEVIVNTLLKIPEEGEEVHFIKAGTTLAHIWFTDKVDFVLNPKFKKPFALKFFGSNQNFYPN